MDTTYFGRQYGVLVLYDSVHKEALSVAEVKYETNALYLAVFNDIRIKGIKIQSVIYDGRKGLIRHFFRTSVQLCQFHQVATINRYLTRKPKSFAGQELRALVLTLKESTKVAFETTLGIWFERHKTYLNERTISQKTGKLIYTHQRLRSAYSSLRNNLNYLFSNCFVYYAEKRVKLI